MDIKDLWTNLTDSFKPHIVPTNPGTRNVISIRMVKHRIKQIDSFLSFSGETAAQELVKDCFFKWAETVKLQAENDLADIVISAYYRQGKIADYLKKINKFAEEISSDDDPETTAIMGYNNYVFFLNVYLNKLFESYEAASQAEKKEILCNKSNVCAFIKNECQSVATIKDLPQAFNDAKLLLEKLNNDLPINPSDCTQILSAAEFLDILEAKASKRNEEFDDILSLQKLLAMYEEKAAAMRKNIEKGKLLYEVLKRLLTPQWVSAFDYKNQNNPISTMTAAEIKGFYIGAMEKINTEILKKFDIE